jgi:hypothetical protein
MLYTSDKIHRALAQFNFKVVRIDQLKVHKIQIVHFTGRQNMGLYVRSLATIFRDALLFHEMEFDQDSLVVNALGKRGRLVFISNEALIGEVLLG